MSSSINSFSQLYRLLLPYRKKWFLVLLLSSVIGLLGLVNPYLTKLMLDEGIAKRNPQFFLFIIVAAGAVYVFTTALYGIKEWSERYIRNKVIFDLNRKLFRHMAALSFGWYKEKTTGEQLYLIDCDVPTAAEWVTTALPQALMIFPKLAATLVILFYLNWQMASLALLLAPLLYLPPYYFSRKMKSVCEKLVRNSEAIYSYLQEHFSHIQLVKAFGKEALAIKNYLEKLIFNLRIRVKNVKLEIFSSLLTELATKIVAGLIILFGGYQIINGNLTLGGLSAIMIYIYQLMALENQFTSFFNTIIVGSISSGRISDIFNQKPQIVELPGAKTLTFKEGKIIFDKVSFGYITQKYVLKELSFRLEGASHIALAGASGCGKTTILNLLVRMYEPWGGGILIDGSNIKTLKLSSLKNQIGLVLQEPFLWNDTIESNITYGKSNASEEEINKASEACGVDQLVKSLSPQGYRTVIGENACKLSEGQKQRLAIARALLKNPKILILDEAMSSMDSASEEKILTNIMENYKQVTLIVVSHRLSTVMRMEKVYYFSDFSNIIVDSAANLLKYNQGFSHLFAGQEGILA